MKTKLIAIHGNYTRYTILRKGHNGWMRTARYIFSLHLLWLLENVLSIKTYTFFYKQSIFDPRPKNCLSFSKKSPQKIV